MITDSMLKKAAEEYANAYMAAIDKEFADSPPHQFSPEFERKIEKIYRRLEHPIMYRVCRSLYRVAAIIVVLFFISSVWLSIDVEAREKVFGWIKDVYEHYFVYRYDDMSSDVSTEGLKHYELTWIPEGYNILDIDRSEYVAYIKYSNDEGLIYKLNYTNQKEAFLFVQRENMIELECMVMGKPAYVYISSDPNVSSIIVWEVDDTVFCISGFLDKNDLIKAAESVKEVKE